MNTPSNPSTRPDLHKRKQNTLIALLGVSLLLGIAEVALQPAGETSNPLLMLGGNIVLLLIGLYWLHLDSTELDIRRPTWLNVGIVLLAAIFVPYYLYKTRPPERRLPAIAAFFGVVLASMAASAIGATLMLAISGAPNTP
jgi:peptidoglycan/LPS O-acetylase OafA/YrhL